MTPDLDAPTGPLVVVAVILWATLGIVVWRIFRADRRERIANHHVNPDESRGPRVHDAADGRAGVAAERLAAPLARAAGAHLARLARRVRRDPDRGDRGKLRRGSDHRSVVGQALLTDDELIALGRWLDSQHHAVDIRALQRAESKVIRAAVAVSRPDVSGVMESRRDR